MAVDNLSMLARRAAGIRQSGISIAAMIKLSWTAFPAW
jgi:hypothetical protein